MEVKEFGEKQTVLLTHSLKTQHLFKHLRHLKPSVGGMQSFCLPDLQVLRDT